MISSLTKTEMGLPRSFRKSYCPQWFLMSLCSVHPPTDSSVHISVDVVSVRPFVNRFICAFNYNSLGSVSGSIPGFGSVLEVLSLTGVLLSKHTVPASVQTSVVDSKKFHFTKDGFLEHHGSTENASPGPEGCVGIKIFTIDSPCLRDILNILTQSTGWRQGIIRELKNGIQCHRYTKHIEYSFLI